MYHFHLHRPGVGLGSRTQGPYSNERGTSWACNIELWRVVPQNDSVYCLLKPEADCFGHFQNSFNYTNHGSVHGQEVRNG